MTPHAKLRNNITDYLTEIGAWYLCTNSHGYGRKGIPDILGFWKGRGFAIEVKVLPDKPSKWQGRELVAISSTGTLAIVAYSLSGVRVLFEHGEYAKRAADSKDYISVV